MNPHRCEVRDLAQFAVTPEQFRLRLLTVCLLGMAVVAAPAKAEGINGVSVEQVVQELTHRDDALFALSLLYKELPRDVGNEIRAGYLRREIAARAPDKFKRDNGHGHQSMNWPDDPFRKTLVIRGNDFEMLHHLNRVLTAGTFSDATTLPGEVDREFLFLALCWWPFPEWPAPQVFDRTWTFHDLFASNQYHLRETLERIGDTPCVVLEVPQVDVLWLNQEHLQCIMRRDIYNPITDAVAGRYEFDGYREVASGIWLPGKLRNLQFDSFADTPELRRRPVIDSTFTLSQIKVNDQVGDAEFHLHIPDGTLQVSGEQSVSQATVATSNQKADLIAIAEWSGRNRGTSPTSLWEAISRYGLRGAALFASALVGLLVVLVIFPTKQSTDSKRLGNG